MKAPSTQTSKGINSIHLFLAFLSLLGLTISGYAQSPTISYPSTAQDITRAYANSYLTVKVIFNGACTGATSVKVALPNSVKYISGSVSKTAGTAGLSISEASISDLSNPVFNITGIAAIADEITFRISRKADCGTLTTGKDSIFVYTSGSCSNGSEIAASINNYNIIAPSLSLTAPTAITGAIIGTTTNRTTTVTNGGNGALDTLRYYVVYPNAGIVNTSGTNAVTANTISFTPYSISGDTLFYKIYGASIFGGDNLFNNGETVTIIEPIKVNKCNTTTTYGVSWGRSLATICGWTTATSSMTMSVGVPVLSTAIVETSVVKPCVPGTVRVTLTNNGSGGVAGAMFNIVSELGNLNPNVSTVVFGPSNLLGNNTSSAITFDSFKIGGSSVAVVQSGTNPWSINMAQFSSDPDGLGVGLDDIDGDGQFDDLAPGKSIIITMNRNYNSFASCVRPDYYRTIGAKTEFSTMCGTLTSPLATSSGTVAQNTGATVTTTTPTLVAGGTPFTIRVCNSGFISQSITIPSDSIYVEMDLPSGISYVSSTAQYNGLTATVSSSGSKVFFAGKRASGGNFCINADFVYACGSSANLKIPYSAYLVLDRTCGAIEYLKCDTIRINAKCPSACSKMANYNPTAQRVNYGWTNTSKSAIVSPSSLPNLSRKTATVYDTINIIQPAKEFGSFNNLYYTYQLSRAAGANVVKFESGTINYKIGGTGATITCSLPTFSDLSTSSLTKWVWNMTPLLGGVCGLPSTVGSGDSMWIDMKLSVTNANNHSLFGTVLTAPPNQSSYLFNLDASSIEQYCDAWAPDFYLLGLSIAGTSQNTPSPINLVGCSPSATTMSNYSLQTREPGDAFPLEYRPGTQLDSIVITYPAGIVWSGATPSMRVDTFVNSFSRSVFYQSTPVVVRGNKIVLINPGTWKFDDLMPATAVQRHNLTFSMVASSAASATGNNFIVTSYGKSFVYSGANIPFVSTYTAPGTNGLTANYNIASKPIVAVQNNTGIVQGVSINQSWDIQLNSNGTTTAPYVWMALEKGLGAGGIVVDSVKLLPSLTTILPTSTYNIPDKWYQISTAGLASGAIQQARVFFRYNSCTSDSILLKSGWDCSAYPSPNPLSYSGASSSTYLKVNSEPSEIQLSVLRQPGAGLSIPLCTTDSILLVVNSAQSANLIDPYVVVYPPAGLNISSTIKIEYPLGSGNYQNATVSSIAGGGKKIDLKSHTGIGTNGILGTASSNSSYSPLGGDRQAKIKIDFNTDCSLISGNSFVFYAYGKMPCGANAQGNGVTASTNALNITGATASGSAGALISIDSTVLNCGVPTTMNLLTVPTSLGTQVGDTMIYTLPVGLGYAGNFVKGTNCTNCEVSSSVGLGGTTVVKVKLDTAIAAATFMRYSFDVIPKGSGCASANINGFFKRLISPLSCGATLCSSSSVFIATVTSPSIAIKKPILNITNVSLVDTNTWVLSGSTNLVKVKYNNSGTQAYSANTDSIEFFCGSSTTPFAIRALSKNVAIGANDSDTYSIILPSSGCLAADLVTSFIKVQTETESGTKQCLCSGSSFTLNVTPSIGKDTIFYCQGATASALTASGFNLRWYTTAAGGIGSSTAPTPSTTTPGNTTYYVSQTSSLGYESQRVPINVNVQSAPAAPTVATPIALCQGTTATALSASSAKLTDSLKWYTASSGGTGSLTAPTPATISTGATSFYVSAKSNIGCEGPRSEIVVNINPTPTTPTVSSSISYCQGATASVLSATGTNLKWYSAATGGTGSTTAPTPSTSTVGTINYYVSQSNSASIGGCEGNRTLIAVTTNPLPSVPTVTTPVAYCQGAAATSLSASGTSLKWYNAATGGIGSATAPTPSTSTSGTTTYYVSQTSAAGVGACEGSRTAINVVVNSLPAAPTVSTPVNICKGSSTVALTATGTSLLWYSSATGGSGSSTAPTPSAASVGTTTYYVSQTSAASAGGCEGARTAIAVNINDVPALPTVTSSISYCQGATASVLSATGTNIKWYSAATGGTGSTTAPTPSTTAAGTTSYYVSQTNSASIGGCEGNRAMITVTINPLPTAPTVATPVSYCQGATATSLSATGSSLLWYTSASGGSGSAAAPTPSTSASGTTTYYVSQTSAASVGSCEGSRTAINVVVNPLPSSPGVISPMKPCIGSPSTSLTASGINLLWYTSATGGSGTSTAPSTLTAAISTKDYFVSQTSAASAGSCEGPRSKITVQVQPLPVVSISSTSSTGTIYCRNKSITLLATAPTATTYQWSFGKSLIAGAVSNTIIADSSTWYNVTVKDANGCLNKDSVQVRKDTSMVPVLSPTEVKICEESSQLLTVNPGFVGWTFEWVKDGIVHSPAAAINLKNMNLAGTYTVIVKNKVGCIDTTNEAKISYYPKPSKPTIINKDPILEVPNVYSHYQWYRNGVKLISTNFFRYTTLTPGFYHVEITDKNGCLNQSDTVEIKNTTNIAIHSAKGLLKIYPNPTYNKVFIESPIPINVKVLDVTGRLILDTHQANEINLEPFADGTYILMITDLEDQLITVEKINKMN